MAKLKQDLIDELTELGVKLTGEEKVADLEALLEEHGKIEDSGSSEDVEETPKGADEEVNEARLEPKPEPEAKTSEDDGDYLRQYQYKKVNDVPTVGGAHTDPDNGSKAEKMKVHLLGQPRVRILVPRAPGEHASVLMTVNLNGYRLDFPKNTYIEMPVQVADVIMQSQAQTDAALQAFRIDGDAKKETALL